jgi:hypothetical protein
LEQSARFESAFLLELCNFTIAQLHFGIAQLHLAIAQLHLGMLEERAVAISSTYIPNLAHLL